MKRSFLSLALLLLFAITAHAQLTDTMTVFFVPRTSESATREANLRGSRV